MARQRLGDSDPGGYWGLVMPSSRAGSRKRSRLPVARGLGTHKIVAFVGTTDPRRAKAFYRDALGLHLVSEDPFALEFDAHGTMLRITTVQEVAKAQYTVLGWQVSNIVASIKSLQSAGVTFERYQGVPQDDLGIWTSPTGAKVAWFKDPDANTLSLTQF
jgi:catechol 2,3-dioxygenase-like lactoylglutathione lyase family enzyme